MKEKREFIIDGFVYTSVKLAYEDLNPPISYALFRNRLYKGVTGEKLVAPSKKLKYNGQDMPEVIINGIHYKSVADAYRKLKPEITLMGFYSRFKNGLRDNELLAPFWSNNTKTTSVIIDSITYRSIHLAYKQIKPSIDYSTFTSIIQKHVQHGNTTLSEILSHVKNGIYVENIFYPNAKIAHETLNLKIPMASFRKHILSIPFQSNIALSDLKKYEKIYQINGKSYTTITKAYDDIKPNVSLSTFIKRYKAGLSYTEIIGEDKRVRINGKIYKSVAQAYSELKPKIPLNTFRYRLKQKYSFEKLMNRERAI